MNYSKSEKIGVYAIKNEILKNELLDDEIPVNDKTPSWDGEIFVYNDRNHKASNLYGTVPVQVKTTKVERFSEDKIRYRLKREHIQNYFDKGGVLYFIVEYINSEQTKIYYDLLLPIDLKKLKEKMKVKNRQSILHEFTALPNEQHAMDTICRSFLINSYKQKSLDLLNIELFDIDKEGFVIPSVNSKLSTIFNYPTYIYSKEGHYNLDIPIDKIRIFEVVEEDDLEIGVCGRVYYSNIRRRIGKDKIVLEFGKSFKMIFSREPVFKDQNIEIKFSERGVLNERLKDCKFMLNISRANHIEIVGHSVEINVANDKVTKGLHERIRYLEELNQVFKILNISNDIPMDTFKVDDLKNLELLRNIILYQDYSMLNLGQVKFLSLSISDIDILLAVKEENGKWYVFNAFESDRLFRIRASKDKNGPWFEVSPYMMLEVKNLFKMANLNLKEVERSLLQIDYDMDSARALVNQFLLDIITYYDDIDKNVLFLKVAENVYRHLRRFNDDTTNFLNMMQIVKRQREFNDGEIEQIIENKNKEQDPFVICAYAALLGNKTEFDYYFKKLAMEEQENFKGFPIYKLIAVNHLVK